MRLPCCQHLCPTYELLNQQTDYHKIRYELYGFGLHPTLFTFVNSLSVLTI